MCYMCYNNIKMTCKSEDDAFVNAKQLEFFFSNKRPLLQMAFLYLFVAEPLYIF